MQQQLNKQHDTRVCCHHKGKDFWWWCSYNFNFVLFERGIESHKGELQLAIKLQVLQTYNLFSQKVRVSEDRNTAIINQS